MEPAVREAPRSVLFVDDDELLLRSYASYFSTAGITVWTASGVDRALEQLASARVGCLVTDLSMPSRTGHELIQEVRRRAGDLPIIVVSSVDRIDDAIQCMRQGVIDFLRKPVDPSQLRETVLRVLDRAPSTAAPSPPGAAPAGPRPEWKRLLTVLQRLRTGEMPLPAFPGIVLELRRLLRGPDASAAKVTALVESDPHVTLRLLRMANSTAFAGVGKITDVKVAIVRLGLQQTSQVVDAIVAQRFFVPTGAQEREFFSGVWRHSLVRAMTMQALAQRDPQARVAPENAYLAGLFADVGTSFLGRIITEVMPGSPLAEALPVLAEHHAAVGATIAEAWHLPAECASCCRSHHLPDEPAPEPALELLRGAEVVAQELGASGDLLPVPGGAAALERLGVGAEELAALVLRARAKLKDFGPVFEGASPEAKA